MKLSDLTRSLVLRGFQKKDGNEHGTYVPPTGGKYWLILDAADSLDGNTWLCICPDDREFQIGVCVDPGGDVIECSISDDHVAARLIEYSPIPPSVDELLNGYHAAIDSIDGLAGDGLFDHSKLIKQLQHRLPAGLYVAAASEKGQAND